MKATSFALAGLIGCAPGLAALDEPAPANITAAPAPKNAKAPEKPRLRLGGFAYGPPQESLPTPAARFQEYVEVPGRARRDPNVAIAVYMKSLHLDDHPVYKGAGPMATSPYGTPIVNLVPVVEKLIEKIKEKKDQP